MYRFLEHITDQWLSVIIFALYVVVIVTCVIVVLRENRNPIRSLAWVIALIFLPVVGFIFYMFFGRSLKGMHLTSIHNRRKLMSEAAKRRADLDELDLTAVERSLVMLSQSLCGSNLTVNNSYRIFTTGAEKFKALIDDLRNAKSSILLQYYIFADDNIGNEIADILIEKAQAGLKVFVIYDHVGSFTSSSNFFRRMMKAGVEIHPFFRVTFPQLANRINWRNHRKIVVIDNRVGYVGGMNIADRYARSEKEGLAWRDTHFRLEGDIVESLAFCFSVDWHFLRDKPDSLPLEIPKTDIRNKVGMQFVVSGPINYWDNLTLTYLKVIGSASKRIFIQTPYFLPTDSLMHALEVAALSKVDVRIMLPGDSDSKMLQYATFSYITRCLKAGIKVYIYQPGMLHSKMMVVDDSLATVGSTNFDFRSFENNFECSLFVYDQGFNAECREIFFKDLAECRKITLKQWKKRPMVSRVMESILRLVSPIL